MLTIGKSCMTWNLPVVFLCLALRSPSTSAAQNAPAPTPEIKALLDRANADEKQGRANEAIRQYEQALLSARDRKDAAGEADALAPLIALVPATFRSVPGNASPPMAIPAVQAALEQGHAKQKEARLTEAAGLYEQALQTAREQKDLAGEASALTFLGRLSLFDASLPRPQGFYARALPLYREIGDVSSQADYLFFLGIGAISLNRLEPGVALFEGAIQRFQAAGDREGEALASDMIGLSYDRAGQPKKTQPYFERALLLYKGTGDRYRQSLTLLSLGKAASDTGEGRQALNYFQEGEQIAHEIGDQRAEGRFLLDIATTKDSSDDTRAALAAYAECLPIMEATNDSLGLATCLHNMERLYGLAGSYIKALEMQERYVRLVQQVGDQHDNVNALNDLGVFYLRMSATEKALIYFQQALQANEHNMNLIDQAMTLSNLGETYDQLGQKKQGRVALEQARDLYRKAGDPRGEANTLRALSQICLSTGDRKQALADVTRSQELFHKIEDPTDEARALTLRGDCFVEAQQFAAGSDCYRQALGMCQKSGSVIGEAEALSRIGTLESVLGHIPEATLVCAQSLDLYEHMRANLGGLTQLKLGYIESYSDTYQRYLSLLLKTRQNEQAFQWAQRAKARVLVDLMEDGKVETQQTLDAQEERRNADLKHRDRELSKLWLNALGEVNSTGRQADKTQRTRAEKQLHVVQQQQQQLERDWDAFSEAVYLRNPHETQSHAAHTVTLDEAAALLTQEDALLEYAVVKEIVGDQERDELALFVVTNEKGKPRLTVYRLASDVSALAGMAQEFRDACAGRPGSISELPYQNLARQLYRQLIAPAEATLANRRHLIFCPDGPLWDVPFQALLIPGSVQKGKTQTARAEFLWERYAVSYAYSGTGLKAALDIRRRPGRAEAPKTLLVMADPDFGQSNASQSLAMRAVPAAERSPRQSASGSSLLLRGNPLSPLPSTLIEAAALRDCFPDAAVKTGRDAQEELLKRTGGDYRYLHLATHSLMNDAAPMLSGVVLARPSPNSSEDGILTVREIFNMSLNADMVVLSACETERGAKRTGEGIIGMTWALFVAGVPTQVVSQWDVDDTATAELMGHFYRALKQGKTKEASLRAAGLALLHDGKHAHPFYWAPFVIMGEWH